MAWIEFEEDNIYNSDHIEWISLGKVGEAYGYDKPVPAIKYLRKDHDGIEFFTFGSMDEATIKFEEIKQILMDIKD